MTKVAIDLFGASATSTTPFGKKILAVLRSKHAEDEIGHEDLAKVGADVAGTAREGWGSVGRNDLAVDDAFKSDVVGTSIILVHEAGHLVLEETTLDEEVKNRSIEIDYYTELETGVTVSGVRCVVPAGFDHDIESQRDLRKRDQLIDHVVKDYHARASGFDAAWIAAHKKDWGGIANRRPFTKGQYLKRLFSASILNAELIVQLLESEAGDKADFAVMIVAADWTEGGL